MIDKEEMDPVGMRDIPPITELHDYELPAEYEFIDRVRQSIDRRETASSFVDLSTRGFFELLMDYLSTIFGAVFSTPDREDGEKES